MELILTNIKDCKNCANAVVYSSFEETSITCECSDYKSKKLFEKEGRYCANKCSSYVNKEEKHMNGNITQDRALEFMLAGKCEVVLHSTKSGEDFKFKIDKQTSNKNKEEFIYFINIIKNTTKVYAGVLWYNQKEFMFKTGKNGTVLPSDLAIRSLLFILNKLLKGEQVNNLEIYHVGRCGKCGKKLTTPESILTGLGPTCSKAAGIERIKLKK